MYSVVLLAALTAGGEAPQFFHHSCHGCYSCSGCSGCYGCWGYGGSYGCCGGGWGSCYGSCYGCGGCWGSGYSYYSCGGCYGCSGYNACYGCSGCYGCWGCTGCYGYSGYAPLYTAPGAVMPPVKPDSELPDPKKKEDKKKDDTSLDLNRAKLTVEVPADARFFIDDQPMRLKTARTFRTPILEPNQTYYYMLKVEVTRDGVTHSETRRVLIRAGTAVRAAFTEEGVVAASRANATAAK